jgi:hypothetical protein
MSIEILPQTHQNLCFKFNEPREQGKPRLLTNSDMIHADPVGRLAFFCMFFTPIIQFCHFIITANDHLVENNLSAILSL